MGLADLPTLAEVAASRIGKPIAKGPTRLETKAEKDTIDVKQLEQWRTNVYTRDKFKCRVCKRKVMRTLELKPDQAHAHHIVSRSNKAIRYDRRNGVTCCPKCHEDIERNRVVILGKASEMFQVDGTSYLNGDVMTLAFKRK